MLYTLHINNYIVRSQLYRYQNSQRYRHSLEWKSAVFLHKFNSLLPMMCRLHINNYIVRSQLHRYQNSPRYRHSLESKSAVFLHKFSSLLPMMCRLYINNYIVHSQLHRYQNILIRNRMLEDYCYDCFLCKLNNSLK
jgi:hypothetical protein